MGWQDTGALDSGAALLGPVLWSVAPRPGLPAAPGTTPTLPTRLCTLASGRGGPDLAPQWVRWNHPSSFYFRTQTKIPLGPHLGRCGLTVYLFWGFTPRGIAEASRPLMAHSRARDVGLSKGHTCCRPPAPNPTLTGPWVLAGGLDVVGEAGFSRPTDRLSLLPSLLGMLRECGACGAGRPNSRPTAPCPQAALPALLTRMP